MPLFLSITRRLSICKTFKYSTRCGIGGRPLHPLFLDSQQDPFQAYGLNFSIERLINIYPRDGKHGLKYQQSCAQTARGRGGGQHALLQPVAENPYERQTWASPAAAGRGREGELNSVGSHEYW
jgi:hypothetical protein